MPSSPRTSRVPSGPVNRSSARTATGKATGAANRTAGDRGRSEKPLSGLGAFLKQVIKNNKHTGAVFPSSPGLARAMTRSLRAHVGPKRLLEVGPGTGPFTKFMLKSLKAGDELHIVEINPEFAQRLEETLLQPFRETNPRAAVKLHQSAIEKAALDDLGGFDYIVCGLPFNNFPPPLVRSIFRQLMELLKPGGELAYFEYAAVRVMKGAVVGDEGRKKLKSIGQVGEVLRKRHKGKRELVWSNVPPAVAVRLTR